MFKSFVEEIVPSEITPAEKEKAMKLISNWLVLSDYLSAENLSLKELGLLLTVEAKTKNRPQIMQRLTMRISAQATKVLKAEIRERLDA